jgi:hypothetical protein
MSPELRGVVSSIVAAVLIVVPSLFAIVRFFVERHFRLQADERLQRVKAQLDSEATAANFRHQRSLHEFSLFVDKKHNALAGLHALINDAHSKILFLEWEVPTLTRDNNKIDAEEWLRDHGNVPTGVRKEVMDLWDSDRESAMEVLREYLEKMKPIYAERAWVKANNFRLDNDLYFPVSVSEAAEKVTALLVEVLEISRNGGCPNKQPAREAVATLRGLMKAELMG